MQGAEKKSSPDAKVISGGPPPCQPGRRGWPCVGAAGNGARRPATERVSTSPMGRSRSPQPGSLRTPPSRTPAAARPPLTALDEHREVPTYQHRRVTLVRLTRHIAERPRVPAHLAELGLAAQATKPLCTMLILHEWSISAHSRAGDFVCARLAPPPPSLSGHCRAYEDQGGGERSPMMSTCCHAPRNAIAAATRAASANSKSLGPDGVQIITGLLARLQHVVADDMTRQYKIASV